MFKLATDPRAHTDPLIHLDGSIGTKTQIGDDLDADLGNGTWQLGLRRILGE